MDSTTFLLHPRVIEFFGIKDTNPFNDDELCPNAEFQEAVEVLLVSSIETLTKNEFYSTTNDNIDCDILCEIEEPEASLEELEEKLIKTKKIVFELEQEIYFRKYKKSNGEEK